MAQQESGMLGYGIPENWLHYSSFLQPCLHYQHHGLLPPPPPSQMDDYFMLNSTTLSGSYTTHQGEGDEWPMVLHGEEVHMANEEEVPKLEDFLGGMGSLPLDHGVQLMDQNTPEGTHVGSTSSHAQGLGGDQHQNMSLNGSSTRKKRTPSAQGGDEKSGVVVLEKGGDGCVGSDGVVCTVAPPPPPQLPQPQQTHPPQRTSSYRGVTRHRWTGRYEAHLWDNSCVREGQKRKGRQVYLGGYDKEEKAARAYDLASLKYWGPTASTNFPELDEMKDMSKQEFIASLRRRSSGFSRGASIYRGVTRHHQHGRWQARIGRVAGNKDLYLGTFTTEQEAAEAYDIAAIKFRGANAVTNFELSRYDLEAIARCDLPIGSSARRLRLSSQVESHGQSISRSPQSSVQIEPDHQGSFICPSSSSRDATIAYVASEQPPLSTYRPGWDWLSINTQHEWETKCVGAMGGHERLQLTVASSNQ